MKIHIHNLFYACTICCFLSTVASAQVNNVYERMSLDEILNIDVVVTASKVPEDLFETPLSVTILKRADILNAGATNIMEALRLSPGLLVRETTPGNFDVQIRGFDDMTKNGYITLPYNTTALVMIDNRIVYSYFSGGTFWETLPIDIYDIERIEVVRGPASALYGANAATGVINIITTHAEKQGLNVLAMANGGNNKAKNVHTSIGYNWSNRTKLSLSGNYTERWRIDNMYYNWSLSEYTTMDEMEIMMDLEKNPETHELWTYKDFSEYAGGEYTIGKSLQHFGANLFLEHHFDRQSIVNVAVGTQKSQYQKPGFLNFATPISENNSSGFYFDSRIQHRNFSVQYNFSTGEDLSHLPANSFKYLNSDLNIEYLYKYKSLSFRPGFSMKNNRYNSPIIYNEAFESVKMNYEFKDEARTMNSFAWSILTDWKPTANWRIIGGGRVDKFDINKNYFLNYELAATYRIDKRNLIRAVYSSANRSPFFLDTYLNASLSFYYPYITEPNTQAIDMPIQLNLLAKRDQKYPRNNSVEISWRNKASSKISFDTEIFFQKIDNLIVSNAYRTLDTKIQLNAESKIDSVISGIGKADVYFENFDVGAYQYGMSFTVLFNPTKKSDIKFFGTLQKTELTGITDVRFNVTDTKISIDQSNNTMQTTIMSNTNMTLWSKKLTPTFYGGFFCNQTINQRLNLNLNGYFYTRQVFAGIPFYNIISDYTGKTWDNYKTINPFVILNTKLTYQLNPKSKVFFNYKNMLGKHREFGFTDNIGSTVLVGFEWNY